MRLVSFRHKGWPGFGIRTEMGIVDLPRAWRSCLNKTQFIDCRGFLALGPEAWRTARTVADWALISQSSLSDDDRPFVLDPAEVELRPPVPNPDKIFCVGRNYAEHAREAGQEITARPVIFTRYAQSLVAPGEAVVRPIVSDQLDWEGEIAVVIGADARHVPIAKAHEVIAGYALFNDVTVRDYQFHTGQFTPGKNFDATAPFGPELVTADEIGGECLEFTVTVNDELVQKGDTTQLIFPVAQLISYLSEWTTLRPGDVIATGTPAGVGHSMSPRRFLRPGDVVRVESPQLGVLSNVVDQELATD